MYPRRLFFDLEVSPNIVYSWRIGYNIRLMPENILKERAVICISYKWEGEEEVHNLRWDRKRCDKKMLKNFLKVLEKASEVVAHNGDRFDIPWLRGRYLYHGLEFPVRIHSLDTLKKVKGVNGFNFNSNKLDYIAQYLGVGQKINTSYDLWTGCMEGNKESLDKMVEYCDMDVIILEKVYKKLQPYITVNTHHGVLKGGEKYSCPNCGHNRPRQKKQYTTRTGQIRYHMKCQDCKTGYVLSSKTYQDLVTDRLRNANKV